MFSDGPQSDLIRGDPGQLARLSRGPYLYFYLQSTLAYWSIISLPARALTGGVLVLK